MSANCDASVIFPILPKNAGFLQKNTDISKINEVLVLKGIFLKLHMCVYLRTKFQVSSIILTRFSQGVILSPTAKETLKKPTQIRVKSDPGKFSLPVLGEKTCCKHILINSKFIDSSDNVILLSITIDKTGF